MLTSGEVRKQVLDKFNEFYPPETLRKDALERLITLIVDYINEGRFNPKFIFETLDNIVTSVKSSYLMEL